MGPLDKLIFMDLQVSIGPMTNPYEAKLSGNYPTDIMAECDSNSSHWLRVEKS